MKVHRCCQCYAPLPIERATQHVLRCNFCGTDHVVSSAKVNEERQLHQEQRLGGLVAPYLIAPFIGFFGYLAYRDFLFAPYEGRPAMLVAIAFVVLGLMGFRMAAALGLVLVGLAGVLKPFVRGIPDWDAGYMSPTSETAFYYLVPGALAAFVAFLFFASLRVRELRPALLALIPRYTVAAVGLCGAVGAHFIVGESIVEVTRQYRSEMHSFEALARSACGGELEEDLDAELSPPWDGSSQAGNKTNSFFVSCGGLNGETSTTRDPLLIDQFALLQRTMAGRNSSMYRGATDADRQRYASMFAADYLVVVDSASDHIGYLISIKNGKVVRKTRFVSALNGIAGSQRLLAGLLGEHSWAMASLSGSKATSEPPPPPPEAAYVYHSTSLRGDATWFFGIATNTGKVALSKPEVLVVYKDEDGKELGSKHGFGAYDLAPGESCPVTILDTDAPPYASVEFELNLRANTTVPGAQGVSIAEKQVKVTKSGVIEISGKVKNEGDKAARFVQIFLSLYNADNILVDARSTFAKSDSLVAGGEARFFMQLYGIGSDEAELRYEFTVRAQIDTR